MDQVSTVTGGIVTLFVAFLTIMFAILKLQHMLARKNPDISKFESDIFGDDHHFELDPRSNFQVAFGIENTISGFKSDPKFIKFVVKVAKQIEGVYTSKYYPMHACSEDDYSKFFPIESSKQIKLDKMRDQSALFCLDWETLDLEIYGSWTNGGDY